MKKYLWLLFIFILTQATKAQFTNSEFIGALTLVQEKSNPYPEKIVHWGFGKEKNLFVRYNPVSIVFATLMYVYQKSISPQISAQCMFSPSCSEFSKCLIHDHGIVRGILGSADRLTRCTRISASTLYEYKISKDGKIWEKTDAYKIHP